MILAALFALGFILDLIWFGCVAVARTNQAALAAVLSASFAGVVLLSSWQVIEARSWSQFAAYILGQAVGAYAFVKVRDVWTQRSAT